LYLAFLLLSNNLIDEPNYYYEPGWLSGIALGYGLDDRRFKSWQCLGMFFFTSASKPVLRHTQPPIQWVTGALSLGVKRPGLETDHSTPSNAEVKNALSYASTPPVRLHDVVPG
jgi:hypothetical protein